MLVKSLGEKIRNRRKELSITQPHLAELQVVVHYAINTFEFKN